VVENEGGFFVGGVRGWPPNPRRGTNRKGRWCAGGDGVGAVGEKLGGNGRGESFFRGV